MPLFGDMDMTKVMFGQDASRGYGWIALQPVWQLNAQNRQMIAIVGAIAFDADVLSKECIENKYAHELVEGELIVRPVKKVCGNGLAGYGLSGIATAHPHDLFVDVKKTRSTR